MSELLDVLLADTQRAIERRSKPAPPVPVSRADQIIAEGDRKRVAYRCMNPDADTAMVFGAQVGYLHGKVRDLCHEAEALTIKRDTNLMYASVFCDELDCEVLAGYSYTAGEDAQISGPPENCYEGSPEELELCEVWVNGCDIAAVLLERVAEQLTEAALSHHRDWLDGQRDEAAEARGMRWD